MEKGIFFRLANQRPGFSTTVYTNATYRWVTKFFDPALVEELNYVVEDSAKFKEILGEDLEDHMTRDLGQFLGFRDRRSHQNILFYLLAKC